MHTLETPRLLVRVETLEEYLHKFSTADDDTLKSYFGYKTDAELQTQKEKIDGGFTTYRTSLMFFHLVHKERSEVIGSISLHNWYPKLFRSETGYDMRQPENRNKGYMREAFPLVIAYGFGAMSLNRIEAFIAPDNIPSRKLVESTGFQQEGVLQEHYYHNGIFTDSVVYGLLSRNYKR